MSTDDVLHSEQAQKESRKAGGRDPDIDSLRGVAIGVVLLLHFALAFGLTDSPLGELLGRWWTRALVLNGNFGVTLFFVVSGFLITRNLLRRHGALRHIHLKRFYVERAARILPPLLLALVLIVPAGLFGLPHFANTIRGEVDPTWLWLASVGSVLTFWHNHLMQSQGYFNYCLNVYWSLSVEEVFYLGFPLVCVLLRKNALIVLGCLGLIAAGPWYRSQHLEDEIFYLYGYFACFDAIAIGCLCAMVCQHWTLRAPLGRLIRLPTALTLVILYLNGFGEDPTWSFTLLALTTAVWIWAGQAPPDAEARPTLPMTATAQSRSSLRRRLDHVSPLRWLGRHSYELYLFHIIVLAVLRQFINRDAMTYSNRLPLLAFYLVLSALLAAVVARQFATPLNHYLRRRFAPPA